MIIDRLSQKEHFLCRCLSFSTKHSSILGKRELHSRPVFDSNLAERPLHIIEPDNMAVSSNVNVVVSSRSDRDCVIDLFLTQELAVVFSCPSSDPNCACSSLCESVNAPVKCIYYTLQDYTRQASEQFIGLNVQ